MIDVDGAITFPVSVYIGDAEAEPACEDRPIVNATELTVDLLGEDSNERQVLDRPRMKALYVRVALPLHLPRPPSGHFPGGRLRPTESNVGSLDARRPGFSPGDQRLPSLLPGKRGNPRDWEPV